MKLLEKEFFPSLGARPIAETSAPELLAVLRKIEARGTIEMPKKSMQIAGQVFRFGAATGRAQRDPTPDLKGALRMRKVKHMARVTEPSCRSSCERSRHTRAICRRALR